MIVEGVCIVKLPEYTSGFTDFTVQITPIYNGKLRVLNASEVENGKFSVCGENGPFHWNITAKRQSIVVEPTKSEISVQGSGPYKYVV